MLNMAVYSVLSLRSKIHTSAEYSTTIAIKLFVKGFLNCNYIASLA